MSTPEQSRSEMVRLRAASEWAQRLAASDDPLTVQHWLAWCDQDARNLSAFERIQEVWVGLPQAGTLSTKPTARSVRRYRLIALAASLCFLAAGIAWLMGRSPQMRLVSTAVAQQRHETLSDGSQLDVAPDSRLRIRFSPWRRELLLDHGQMYVSVAPGRIRPFVVSANGLTATATGTAFDVRVDSGVTVLTVSEGRVTVTPMDVGPSPAPTREGAPFLAAAGEQIAVDAAAHRLQVRTVDPTLTESWRSGMLEFVGEPLQAVVDEVDRFVKRRIVLSAALRDTRYTGTVSPHHVDDWLEALKQIYSVQVVIDEGADEIHIRARDDQQSPIRS
jgi:transmembrane sensor